MGTMILKLPATLNTLPTGYRFGAHTSGAGWEGYYVIREVDNASTIAHMRPDLVMTTGDDPDVHEITSELLMEMLEEAPWEIPLDDQMLRAFRTAAAAAGDSAQVELCGEALDGDSEARESCAALLTDARAMDETAPLVRVIAE